MASRVHLVRHGEVENPDHIVYADLQNFELSDTGGAQARAASRYLADRPIRAVYSSPLTRAIQTATAIAVPHLLEIEVVDQLTEFGLSRRWRGLRWDDLDDRFPGEVDAYLKHPEDLPFSPESLDEMGVRLESAIRGLENDHPDGEIVVVSHQDPVHAARLSLAGREFSSFGDGKPGHAEVITLEPGNPWQETARWTPPIESGPFPPPAGGAG